MSNQISTVLCEKYHCSSMHILGGKGTDKRKLRQVMPESRMETGVWGLPEWWWAGGHGSASH